MPYVVTVYVCSKPTNGIYQVEPEPHVVHELPPRVATDADAQQQLRYYVEAAVRLSVRDLAYLSVGERRSDGTIRVIESTRVQGRELVPFAPRPRLDDEVDRGAAVVEVRFRNAISSSGRCFHYFADEVAARRAARDHRPWNNTASEIFPLPPHPAQLALSPSGPGPVPRSAHPDDTAGPERAQPRPAHPHAPAPATNSCGVAPTRF